VAFKIGSSGKGGKAKRKKQLENEKEVATYEEARIRAQKEANEATMKSCRQEEVMKQQHVEKMQQEAKEKTINEDLKLAQEVEACKKREQEEAKKKTNEEVGDLEPMDMGTSNPKTYFKSIRPSSIGGHFPLSELSLGNFTLSKSEKVIIMDTFVFNMTKLCMVKQSHNKLKLPGVLELILTTKTPLIADIKANPNSKAST
jgi:phage-related minor tail protein